MTIATGWRALLNTHQWDNARDGVELCHGAIRKVVNVWDTFRQLGGTHACGSILTYFSDTLEQHDMS